MDVMEEVFRPAYEGRLDDAIEGLVARLAGHPPGPFRDAREARFDVSPRRVNGWLDEMASALAERIDLRSIYVEMNGFSINPDRWFCDTFGYSRSLVVTSPFEDPEADWFWSLAEWDAELHWERGLTLTGMEPMQRAFQWAKDGGRLGEETSDVAEWLVQCRFLALIRDGVGAGPITPPVPVVAAAHESEPVLRFPPVTPRG